MDDRHEEVLLRMKMMDGLLDDKVDELLYEEEALNSQCYTLRMYTEWVMGIVGPNSETYPEFAKLKDSFLTFEVLLTLDDKDVTEYVSCKLPSKVKKLRRIIGEIIVEIEEMM